MPSFSMYFILCQMLMCFRVVCATIKLVGFQNTTVTSCFCKINCRIVAKAKCFMLVYERRLVV